MSNIHETKEITKDIYNHSVFAEELLIPHANNCDSFRLNMFTNHLPQAKVLDNPDFPRVFTNFENQIGKYSTAYKIADQDIKIIKRFDKNSMNQLFVIKYMDTGVYDVLLIKPAVRITERYGYKNKPSILLEKKEKEIIKKDEVLYSNTSYDENMNFCYGKNMKALLMAYGHLTYEDGIPIKESSINKFDCTSVDETIITLNTNDVLLNLKGNDEEYKCFPDIGEGCNNSILTGRRRINHESVLFDFNTRNIKTINPDTDTIFFVNRNSFVYDIEVFCNSDCSKLEDYEYYKQILKYKYNNDNFYRKVSNYLKQIIDKGLPCGDDLKYYWKRYTDLIDENTTFPYEDASFDNMIIIIRTMNTKHLSIGMKLTGRFGNKGVISAIIPDNEFPENEFGEKPDIIVNPMSVIGRLTLGLVIEIELNFCADQHLRQCKKIKNNDAWFAEIIKFYEIMEESITIKDFKKQSSFFKDKWNNFNEEEKEDFRKKCYEKGLYTHEPPFFGNTTQEGIYNLRTKLKIDPYTCKVFDKEIEEKLIFGDIYYLLLKHDPESKMSARSTGDLSLNNTPSKSNSFRYHTTMFSKTPVRCGEMEFMSLLLTKNIKLILRLFAQTSTNPEERKNFNTALLTRNVFNIEKIELLGNPSITSQIFKIQMLALGLENKRSLEDVVDNIEDYEDNLEK